MVRLEYVLSPGPGNGTIGARGCRGVVVGLFHQCEGSVARRMKVTLPTDVDVDGRNRTCCNSGGVSPQGTLNVSVTGGWEREVARQSCGRDDGERHVPIPTLQGDKREVTVNGVRRGSLGPLNTRK